MFCGYSDVAACTGDASHSAISHIILIDYYGLFRAHFSIHAGAVAAFIDAEY